MPTVERQQPLCDCDPRTVAQAIEAAIRQGWDRIIGSDGAFIGMTGFGASGPYEALYKHFGITADAVVDVAERRLHGVARALA